MLSAAGRRELALWPAATVTGLHRSADESQRIDACLTHLCGLSKPTWESFVVNESIVRLTVQQQAAHSLCSGSRSAGWGKVSLAAAAKPASSLPPRWLSPKMESPRRLWNFTAPSRLRVPAEILKGGQMHNTGERLRHEMWVFCSR